jgi:lipopolysaccharide transport system ATP-binding protein
MRKAEIERKFDEIVAFAEVEKFIDTPVKRYSSGMYVRLAFAVAAHMETEVLIVDEVLAVGDIQFQRKCLGKMSDVAKAGRTVLFVSHNMLAITRLGERAILLDGSIKADGPASAVVQIYLDSDLKVAASKVWSEKERRPGNDIVRIVSARVHSQEGRELPVADIRRPIGIEVVYEVLKPGHILIPNFHFFNDDGLCLFAVQDVTSEWRSTPRPVGLHLSTAWIPGNFLAEGNHVVGVAVSSHLPGPAIHFFEPAVLAFQVVDTHDGDSARGDFTGQMPGLVRPLVEWTTSWSNSAN